MLDDGCVHECGGVHVIHLDGRTVRQTLKTANHTAYVWELRGMDDKNLTVWLAELAAWRNHRPRCTHKDKLVL